jgi:hypothetical protein
MTATSPDRDSTEGRPGKKLYRSPRLHVYGNIRDITQGAGHRNNRDHLGSGGGFKSLP